MGTLGNATSIYFISENYRENPVKIGISGDPVRRLSEIQSFHPVNLQIAARAPGKRLHEKKLHQKFSELRMRGEWFRPSPDLTSIIEYVALNGRLPRIVIKKTKVNKIKPERPGRGPHWKIINNFGGTAALAKALKLDPRIISNWKNRKTGISAAGRYMIRDLARRKRKELPEGFIGGTG